ncbi:MAG: alpha-amylase family protein [Propionibacteriaceae bacterium]|jgi:glycosidase|nr:alpha-amylase family protein [Propionibacteriaceae bacterium]
MATTPSWVSHCVWWQVYPLGFSGAHPPTGVAGRGLRHLIGWLDYARDLGASGLALGPIFSSQSHGYDTLDYFAIDPRLGQSEDFDALVAACHERGLKVMLDGVFNHVGAGHPWLRQALAEGPDGPYAQFFALDWSGGQPKPRFFEGHSSLVELNHQNLQVAEFVQTVMSHWLDRGADAWRLDAAYRTPTPFWHAVIPAVRRDHPEAWFVGEVIHGDYARIVKSSGLDAVTQYELWKAVWSSLASDNFFELDWALRRHNGWLESFAPMTFVGNHDVTRLASQVGQAKIVLALAVLATVGGVPSFYYGDEQGFVGLKQERAGGDDEIRPAFPASPAELSPAGWWVYRACQDLVGLRRRHPWLAGAQTEKRELTTTRYVYASRAPEGELTVELDLGRQPGVVIRDSQGEILYRWPK